MRRFSRPILASVFIVEGIDALIKPKAHVEKVEKVLPPLEKIGLPPVVREQATVITRASGALSVVAGLGLATGVAPRSSAAVLAALNVPLAIVNNPIWLARGKQERSDTLNGLMVRAALGAGLLMASVDREGKPSLMWRASELKRQRELTAAAVAKARAQEQARVA